MITVRTGRVRELIWGGVGSLPPRKIQGDLTFSQLFVNSIALGLLATMDESTSSARVVGFL